MLVRISAVLLAAFLSPLLTSAQTTAQTPQTEPSPSPGTPTLQCTDFTPQIPQCKAKDGTDLPPVVRPICITTKTGQQGKKSPHSVPYVQHVCHQDTVYWQWDPSLSPPPATDFLVIFDQERSPFDRQFFTSKDAGVHQKIKSTNVGHNYHYMVWFPDGTSEDPGIIVH